MAIQALLVILAVLLVLLFLGVPISYAIAVSSLTAILSSIDLNVAVLTAAQRTFEGIHVVDALAHERTFAKQVLVHIRHGASVGVDPGFAAEHACVTRTDAATHAAADAGLQDAVAARDKPLVVVEATAI